MNKRERILTRNSWKKRFKTIETELSDLLIARRIFIEISHIAQQNKDIQSPDLFHRWLIKNYAHRIAMGIRRIIDIDKKEKRAVSLYRLLDDIKQNLLAIPRSDFISQYSRQLIERGIADADFERFAKRGQPLIDPKRIERDQRAISESSDIKRFRKLVDKWIAHNDPRRDSRTIPYLTTLNRLLLRLDKLACKYYLLIGGGECPTFEPSIGDEWKRPLTQPWIKQ